MKTCRCYSERDGASESLGAAVTFSSGGSDGESDVSPHGASETWEGLFSMDRTSYR